MAITKQRPAKEIQERTHFIGIYAPLNAEPRIDILREEVDEDIHHNIGSQCNIVWSKLRSTPAFSTFQQTLGFSTPEDFFAALATLCDDLVVAESLKSKDPKAAR